MKWAKAKGDKVAHRFLKCAGLENWYFRGCNVGGIVSAQRLEFNPPAKVLRCATCSRMKQVSVTR